MILVTGATGNVGSEIARQLIASKTEFRVYARDEAKLHSLIGTEGYEFAEGDFGNEEAFGRALDGVDALYMVTNQSGAFLSDLKRMLAQITASGVKRLVLLSAEGDAESDIFFVRRTGEIEDLVRASGVPHTVLRPDWFMQNFAGFVAAGAVMFPGGPGKVSFVDVRDVAEVAIRALTEEGHVGRTYRLTGPDAMTFEQAAGRIGAALGSDLPFVNLTPDEMREGMIAQGAEPWYADMNAEMTYAVRMGFSFSPANDIRFLLGREARSIETFTAELLAPLQAA